MPPRSNQRKRKAEAELSPSSAKRIKQESGFEKILPPFFRQLDPIGYARFDVQLTLIQDQLRHRKASIAQKQQIAQRCRILCQQTREQELAELAALSVLLDRSEIHLSQLVNNLSFLESLRLTLFSEINELKNKDF